MDPLLADEKDESSNESENLEEKSTANIENGNNLESITAPGENNQAPMSKNQLKKIKKMEKLVKMKAEKRKREREQRKLNGKNNVCIIEKDNGEKEEIKRKSLKNNKMCNSTNKLRIVIDCSFENLMSFSDLRHLTKQLAYCYAANRRMSAPLQLYMTSCTNKTKEVLDRSGLNSWDIHLHDKLYMDVFESEAKENLVYLTSDSPNVLEKFDESKVYIIGGLVDHNHHKSLCYNLAVEKGISHCRLPIGEFMNMKTRTVLTINQVYQIITKYMECGDWKKSFMSTLPKRKGAEVKLANEDTQPPDEKNTKTENLNDDEPESKIVKTDPQPALST